MAPPYISFISADLRTPENTAMDKIDSRLARKFISVGAQKFANGKKHL
jgi:hypothetical protein